MISFPALCVLLVFLLWLPAIEGGQKRNCRGFRGLGSTSPAADHPCGSGFSRELWLQPLPCDSRGRLRAGPDGSWRCQRHSSPTVPESYSVRPGKRSSEEQTSELQSLMRISYAVICLNTNNTSNTAIPT